MTGRSDLTIVIDETRTVSGLLVAPEGAVACYVMAHGAGAGMRHPFMAAAAEGLAARRVATLRYQFPFAEQRQRRPDRPAVAQATVRAAVAAAGRALPATPLFAGGKSFGGRMASQAQAERPLEGVRGLIFLGFPLHPAGTPSQTRAAHLDVVDVPMLFLQGRRDTLADEVLVAQLVAKLGSRGTLVAIDDADHSFHVPVRSGRTDPQVLAYVLDTLADWIARTGAPA